MSPTRLTLHPDRLIRHLLLFDKVLIDSGKASRIEALIAAFGFEGVIALLRSGAIGIHWHVLTIGSTGQLNVLESRSRKGVLPTSFLFVFIRSLWPHA